MPTGARQRDDAPFSVQVAQKPATAQEWAARWRQGLEEAIRGYRREGLLDLAKGLGKIELEILQTMSIPQYHYPLPRAFVIEAVSLYPTRHKGSTWPAWRVEAALERMKEKGLVKEDGRTKGHRVSLTKKGDRIDLILRNLDYLRELKRTGNTY